MRLDGRNVGLIGARASVFEGPPAGVVLVAPGVGIEAVASGPALLVVASAPGGPVRRTAVVAPEEILVEQRGSGQTARKIHRLLAPAAEAGRLIAFEVYTPAGNWSSWPPHKHDTEDAPREARLEELYLYRFARSGADAYYLNIMAGPNRAWAFTVDPDHAAQMDWDPAAPKTAQETPR